MTRIVLLSTVAAIGITIAAHHVVAQASRAAEQAQQQLTDMNELAEQSMQLKSETDSALGKLDEMQKRLEGLQVDENAARRFSEELIGVLRGVAARFAPDSPYIKSLDAQENALRRLSDEALSSTDPSNHIFGEQLKSQASQVAAIREEARTLAGRLAAVMSRLERGKDQITYAYAIKRSDEFIKVARSSLEIAIGVMQRASTLADKRDRIIAPFLPSQ